MTEKTDSKTETKTEAKTAATGDVAKMGSVNEGKTLHIPSKAEFTKSGRKAEEYDDMVKEMIAESKRLSRPYEIGAMPQISQADVQAAKEERLREDSEEPELDPEYQGEKTYLLTEKHYREGRMYEPGDKITVTDEKPGRSWVPLDADGQPMQHKSKRTKAKSRQG